MNPDEPRRRPRSDARANRDRLLRAAREVFAARGLDATLDDVAHHAGLGVGTAYRHFPNKYALIAGLFDDRLAEFIAFAEAALTDPDPWSGFAAAMIRLGEDLADVRALRDLLLRPDEANPLPGAHDLDRVMGALLERAKANGSIRSDVTVTDLPTLVAMADVAAERNPDRWRLFLGLILDGLAVTPTAGTSAGRTGFVGRVQIHSSLDSVSAADDDDLAEVADEYREET